MKRDTSTKLQHSTVASRRRTKTISKSSRSATAAKSSGGPQRRDSTSKALAKRRTTLESEAGRIIAHAKGDRSNGGSSRAAGPRTPDERLAAKKALTLQAFQTAYERRHHRKAS